MRNCNSKMSKCFAACRGTIDVACSVFFPPSSSLCSVSKNLKKNIFFGGRSQRIFCFVCSPLGQWELYFCHSQLPLIWCCQTSDMLSSVGRGSCTALWHMQAALVRRAWTQRVWSRVIHGAVFTACGAGGEHIIGLFLLNPIVVLCFFFCIS